MAAAISCGLFLLVGELKPSKQQMRTAEDKASPGLPGPAAVLAVVLLWFGKSSQM